eukprot:Opistho-2@57410
MYSIGRVTEAIIVVAIVLCAHAIAISVGDIDGGHVCGENGKNYSSKDAAHADGVRALHAGYCGACSNHQDIDVYNVTRNNLTSITKRCAMLYTLLGEHAASKCMDKVGMTVPCQECWMENIECDRHSKCFWICIKSTLRGDPTNKPDGSLNDCLQCDEDVCGPAFIGCAGANRRKSGIHSDIDRPGDQVWEGDDWSPA